MLLTSRTLSLASLVTLSSIASAADVLILDGTVSGGSSSQEAVHCTALGLTVEVASDAAWGAKTAADFGAYRALIFGDPTCAGPGYTPSIAAAIANNAVWGPQVDGNTILFGTDSTYHSVQGGLVLSDAAIDFAVSDAAHTGAVISLSCYFYTATPGSTFPLLDTLPGVTPGAFGITGQAGGCLDDIHVVNPVAALAPATDAVLSNWGCSFHEGFDTWPSSGPGAFTVYAIARNYGTAYTAPDGSVGMPFILVRGSNTGSPTTPFCFGDGTATACPCGNSGAPGNGCASSVNAAGAHLGSSGIARVSSDTLTLLGTGMPNGTALYFQGTNQLNGGLGIAFGDGLRCAGGTVTRLGIKQNAGGASQYPTPGDLSVSVRGLLPPTGGTRTYQAWYRNAVAFCTASTFNLSNGLEVVWIP